jgi:hypothetical protein
VYATDNAAALAYQTVVARPEASVVAALPRAGGTLANITRTVTHAGSVGVEVAWDETGLPGAATFGGGDNAVIVEVAAAREGRIVVVALFQRTSTSPSLARTIAIRAALARASAVATGTTAGPNAQQPAITTRLGAAGVVVAPDIADDTTVDTFQAGLGNANTAGLTRSQAVFTRGGVLLSDSRGQRITSGSAVYPTAAAATRAYRLILTTVQAREVKYERTVIESAHEVVHSLTGRTIPISAGDASAVFQMDEVISRGVDPTTLHIRYEEWFLRRGRVLAWGESLTEPTISDPVPASTIIATIVARIDAAQGAS